MIIFPAIDLYNKKAVRLLKGDYNNMTVYSHKPCEIAKDFESQGATHIHLVDLEGARDGNTPNIEVIKEINNNTTLFTEVGGGIRDMETIHKYISAGVDRVILGTAAVNNPDFLKIAVDTYRDRIAVGADVLDGQIAIKGWLEKAPLTLKQFLKKMEETGITNIICTDISRDGAMKGTNCKLYKDLSEEFSMNITASGGVSSISDIKKLREMNLYGAIIGKAYYEKAINIKEAIEVAK